MAKVFRTVAIVAGAVALVATGIGAVVGAGTFLGIAGSTFTAVGAVAGVVAGVANLGAGLLTKPPPARGSVTDLIIEVDPPSPYVMGEGYFAGMLRHRVGYGPTLNDVPNPYRFLAVALCVAGPIEGPIVPQTDFGPVDSWYSGFLDTDTKLGAVPETALVQKFGSTPPGWGPDYKMSGQAAIGWSLKFDKDGKRFASGMPQLGCLAKWVRVYDPRQDSTRPGGDGPCRIDDESTWVWDGPSGAAIPAGENPALHAGTYAFGRHHPVTGNRVFGIGLPDEGIDWEAIAAWANDCEANEWRVFGPIFEGADDDEQRRYQNLRDICIAGGGEHLFTGAVLGFHWVRPRIALATITDADLAEGTNEVTAMASYRDRLNTMRPQYVEPTSNWSLVAGEEVQNPVYLSEDGEERAETLPLNLVKDVDQATQLAGYWLADGRELSGVITLQPEFRDYRPGECLRFQSEQFELDHDIVIVKRQVDPVTMTVRIAFVSETAAKHAYALGLSGVAPATPTIGQTAEERDGVASSNLEPPGFGTVAISGSYTSGLSGNITQSPNGDGTVTVTIPTHSRIYANNRTVSVTGGTIILPESNNTLIYYDDASRAGGAVTFAAVNTSTGGSAADAYFSETNPNRHFVARVTTVDGSGAGGSTGGSSPPGGGGWDDGDPGDYQTP